MGQLAPLARGQGTGGREAARLAAHPHSHPTGPARWLPALPLLAVVAHHGREGDRDQILPHSQGLSAVSSACRQGHVSLAWEASRLLVVSSPPEAEGWVPICSCASSWPRPPLLAPDCTWHDYASPWGGGVWERRGRSPGRECCLGWPLPCLWPGQRQPLRAKACLQPGPKAVEGEAAHAGADPRGRGLLCYLLQALHSDPWGHTGRCLVAGTGWALENWLCGSHFFLAEGNSAPFVPRSPGGCLPAGGK